MRARLPRALIIALGLVVLAGAAQAAWPEAWQVYFQPSASPIMERVRGFHDLLLWIIVAITIFVLALLLVVCFRFSEKRNPTPSKRTHNTLLEVVWTAVPVLILVIIAVPSFKLLYYTRVIPPADMTIKATGHQWYWSYEYPDNENVAFDAIMIPDDQIDPDKGEIRLLSTDNHVVVPAGKIVRLQITSADVLHSWAMPSMGVKIDAVPGFLNEIWIEAMEPGLYYGQCSELCGANHGFMPIVVDARLPEEFDAWVKQTQAAARGDGGEVDLAAADGGVAPAAVK